jgi:hypothetical protein
MPVQVDQWKRGIDERSVRHLQSARDSVGEVQALSCDAAQAGFNVLVPKLHLGTESSLGSCTASSQRAHCEVQLRRQADRSQVQLGNEESFVGHPVDSVTFQLCRRIKNVLN